MARLYETTLDLFVSGHECTHDVTVVYTVDPACGDGWNEPRTPASASVDRVEVRADNGATVDVYPLLSDKVLRLLEADLLAYEAEQAEPDPDMLRDREFDRSIA